MHNEFSRHLLSYLFHSRLLFLAPGVPDNDGVRLFLPRHHEPMAVAEHRHHDAAEAVDVCGTEVR